MSAPLATAEPLPVPGEGDRGGRGLGEPGLTERVRARLARVEAEPTAARVAAAVRAEGALLGGAAVLGAVGPLRSELAGAGPLEALLREPGVTDVLVNAPDEVWVDRGRGLERADVRFADDAAVRRLAQRLVSAAGRRLDDARPYADACLPDGTRLHAVLAPLAVRGTALSLRVPRRRALTMPELVAGGSVPPRGAGWLTALVSARLTLLVSGGAGSGKTTLLAALLGLADPGERLVLVEDSRELTPAHPHVVRLEARPANVEGAGEVGLRDLVRQALRMRPDRLVVGEVRGAEVVDMLAALNTGHEGGAATLHANAAADVPARLEALAAAAGMGREALHSQLAAGVDAVVHLARHGAGRRRVAEVCVPDRDSSGLVVLRSALSFPGDGSVRAGEGAARLVELLVARGAAVLRCPDELGRGPDRRWPRGGAVVRVWAAALAGAAAYVACARGGGSAFLARAGLHGGTRHSALRARIETVVARAGSRESATGAAVGAAAVAVALGVGSPLLAAAAVVVALVVHRERGAAARARSAAAEGARVREFAALLAAELRAGRSARVAAARAAHDVGAGWPDGVAAAAAGGGDVAAALDAAAGPAGVASASRAAGAPAGPSAAAGLREIAACWRVAEGTGAGLAAGLSMVAAGLREREAQRREIAAQLAGVRASGYLLAALPAFGLFLGSALGANPWRVLVSTGAGNAALAAGVALDALGLAWLGRLGRAAEVAR